MKRRTESGFTLIELLVALFVFAILMLAAYRALSGVSGTRAHLDRETHKWQMLERFFARFDGEVAQALPRPVHNASGAQAPAWSGVLSSARSPEEAQLAFTRNGGFDAQGLPLPPQRIAYRLRQGKLELLRWFALDSAPYNTPTIDVVLDNIREFKLRYLDSLNAWQTQWPLQAGDTQLPRGVELELTLNSGETLTRFFSLR